MTLQDMLILLVAVNLVFSLLILFRMGFVKRELTKLRLKRPYRPAEKKRGRPPKRRGLPF